LVRKKPKGMFPSESRKKTKENSPKEKGEKGSRRKMAVGHWGENPKGVRTIQRGEKEKERIRNVGEKKFTGRDPLSCEKKKEGDQKKNGAPTLKKQSRERKGGGCFLGGAKAGGGSSKKGTRAREGTALPKCRATS